MALKDIISNAELKDDAMIRINDQEYKVGDLRAELSAPPEGYVPREELERVNGEMRQINSNVQALLAAAAKNVDTTQVDPNVRQDPKQMLREALGSLLGSDEYDYGADKYVGPAMERTRKQAIEESLKGADERYNPKLEQLQKDQTAYQKRLAITEGKLWYRQAKKEGEIPENPTTKKTYTLQELAGLAFQHKILDADGWPDYDQVTERLNAPKRQQTAVEQAREEGRREGIRIARERNRQELVVMPGGRSARIGGDNRPAIDTAGKTAGQLFNEALGLAVQDPDIMRDLEEA